MEEKQVFYYKFGYVNFWGFLNLLLLVMLAHCLIRWPCLIFWWQTQVLLGLFIISSAAWVYKHLCKQVMAVITPESIKIDHCNPLKWKDIRFAEERIVHCMGMRRKVIVLVPVDNLDYKYNFLQKHNGEFTPFSIPLYGILSKEDEDKIRTIVAKKVPLKIL